MKTFIKKQLTVKGKFGFVYEFKQDESGSIKFIYYREGEREFCGCVNWIHTGLCDKSDFGAIATTINKTLLAYPSAGARVAKQVVKHFAS